MENEENIRPRDTANPIMAARAGRAKLELDRVKPAVPKNAYGNPSGKEYVNPVTDLKYRQDGYLTDNLNEVPKFLKKAWDCVIIVSGNGKVRIGKSTIAIQIAYYIAWLLNEIRKKNGEVPKDNPVPFDNSNIAFDPEGLMKLAETKPKHSVLVYDEGRAGLDSARAMENINKATQDFFQECGQYGHVIIIVLPDFFKLSETIAVSRSLFLINCYTDKNYNRGLFDFYSEDRKELLYIIGKKKWGSVSKYMSVGPNFYGRFSDFFPINKEIYDEQKKSALKKRRRTSLEVKWRLERDISWWILKTKFDCTDESIAKELRKYPNVKVARETVTNTLNKVKRWLKAEDFSDINEEDYEKTIQNSKN